MGWGRGRAAATFVLQIRGEANAWASVVPERRGTSNCRVGILCNYVLCFEGKQPVGWFLSSRSTSGMHVPRCTLGKTRALTCLESRLPREQLLRISSCDLILSSARSPGVSPTLARLLCNTQPLWRGLHQRPAPALGTRRWKGAAAGAFWGAPGKLEILAAAFRLC